MNARQAFVACPHEGLERAARRVRRLPLVLLDEIVELDVVHVVDSQPLQRALQTGAGRVARALRRLRRQEELAAVLGHPRPHPQLGVAVVGCHVDVVHAEFDEHLEEGVRQLLGRGPQGGRAEDRAAAQVAGPSELCGFDHDPSVPTGTPGPELAARLPGDADAAPTNIRGVMDVSAHVEALEREGALLALAAASAGLDAPVPTCPDWQVRDLVRHLGNVHRWASAVVRSARTSPLDAEEQRALFGPRPRDAELLAWFRSGHGELVEALIDASPDLECWAFLPAPSPLAFWARRQAHETAVHRIDAESAAGEVGPVAAAFAADGIDEMLCGFAAPAAVAPSQRPRALARDPRRRHRRHLDGARWPAVGGGHR